MPIEVIDEITTKNGGQYPLARASNLRGVAQVFADIADRDAFDARKLVIGMDCKTLSPAKRWELTTITPLLWTEVVSGGGGGSVTINGVTGTTFTLNATSVGAEQAGAVATHNAAVGAHGETVAGRALSTAVTNTAQRTVLGLGDSATRNVGTTAGTVASGDDARMADSRTPTAHASSHATGGSDQLTPAAIGAATPASVTSSIATHAGSVDPHGDRAFATAEVAAHVAGSDPHTQYQRESERGVANGYAGLDATTKVPLAQLPTGASAGTVALGDDARFTNARAPTGSATGDLAGSYPAPTIAADTVTNAKLANMPAASFKGTIAAGDPVDLTTAQATSILDLFSPTLRGLVAPSGGGTANFLRADGTWVAPPGGGGGGITDLTGDVTASGTGSVVATIAALAVNDAKVAAANKDGLAATPSMRTLGTGAQQAAAGDDARLSDSRPPTGSAGGDLFGSNYPSPRVALSVLENNNSVPVASQTIKGRVTAGSGFMEDLTPAEATSILDAFTSTLKGLVPSSGGGSTAFLRADGVFAVPAGGGGGATIKTTTLVVPFGAQEQVVTVVDASVTSASKVIVSWGSTTNLDENEPAESNVTFAARGGAVGSFEVVVSANDNENVGGQYRINYLVG